MMLDYIWFHCTKEHRSDEIKLTNTSVQLLTMTRGELKIL